MSDRLTVVPSTEGAPSAPDGPHPIEVARKALREAALVERDELWRSTILRFADALPLRGERR